MAVLGSYARGHQQSDSDVDILVEDIWESIEKSA